MLANMRPNAPLLSLVRGVPTWTLKNTARTLSSTTQRLSDNIKKDQNELLNKHMSESSASDSANTQSQRQQQQQQPTQAKSVGQSDEELREKLERMSGGGGASGIEYEDGKPSTMKRSVRNNMFRYI
ncbi:uncharacterized protein ACHE_60456S [Aspergillus chevalieri]|uniref:Uncharacterized protein n=1 Tax=Aspergillus chevalieri TaxID=182096 RepID=A0A7R7VTL2_ASPCH|nr:uncharacterized protein ACHE_60456S [Aspergillus chevalieri]BCR90570.1 hypothetical protein ACHE_60456S [Aspergillus chevalieri]